MKQRATSLKSDQQGLVAIIVTLIIMLVLTLVVTGFAQLARREQREALDRQLASQALYAAESGINDAEARIRAELAAGNLDNYTDCNAYGDSQAYSDIVNENERPTCILIRKDVPELKFQNVQTNKSTIVPITQKEGGDIDNLTISWQNSEEGNANTIRSLQSGATVGANGIISGNVFAPASGPNSWGANNIGVMRIDLVPVDNLSSSQLREGMFTAFLIPTNSGVAVDYSLGSGPANQGIKVAANCNSGGSYPRICSVQITGLDNGNANYYLRMKSIYNVSDVVVCPSQGFGCDPGGTLIGAQAEIDVTAKAADVLKRVQVRVNTDPNASGSSTIPEYTLDSAEDVCKLLDVTPTGTTSGC